MRLGGPYKPVRGLALGKAFYVRERRGRLYACKWPVKRPRVKHPTTLAQMEKFRQANWMAKFAPARVQQAHRDLVRGTQLLPRDMMVAAMYGRGFTWEIPGHRRRYPVAAVRDLSDNLDLLGAVPGDILARGMDRWEVSRPTNPGQQLISQLPGIPPVWTDPAGGIGIWQQIEDTTLSAGLGLNAYHEVAIPANAQELEFTFFIPATGGGVMPVARINADNGTTYSWMQQGVKNPATAFVQVQANTTFIRLGSTQIGVMTARTSMRGRIFQPAASGNSNYECQMNSGGINMLSMQGAWVWSGSPHISALGFASVSGVGLPIGTRIIVRAAIP